MTGSKLVNAETGEPIAECTPDEARELTDRIGTAMGVAWELVLQAYRTRAWAALGHGSWDAYCTAEFGKFHMRLPSEERDETIASLRAAGLSIRAIAATRIASKKTVERTIAASGVANDDTSITGTDGKTYPGGESAGVRAARERREREAAEAAEPVDHGMCTAGFDCAAKATAADGMCDWHRNKTKDSDGSPPSDEPGAHHPVVPGSTPHGAASEPRTDAPAADTDGTGLASHADGADGGAASSSAATPPSLPDDLSDGELADVIEIAAWLGDTVPAAIAAAAAEADHGDPATVAALALIDQWVTDYMTARTDLLAPQEQQ